MVRDRSMSDACDTIAGALLGGQPLHRAIEEATTLRMNEVIRERLREWQAGVEAGQPPDEAARQTKLPPLFSGMIGPGRPRGPPPPRRVLSSFSPRRLSRSPEIIPAAAAPM